MVVACSGPALVQVAFLVIVALGLANSLAPEQDVFDDAYLSRQLIQSNNTTALNPSQCMPSEDGDWWYRVVPFFEDSCNGFKWNVDGNPQVADVGRRILVFWDGLKRDANTNFGFPSDTAIFGNGCIGSIHTSSTVNYAIDVPLSTAYIGQELWQYTSNETGAQNYFIRCKPSVGAGTLAFAAESCRIMHWDSRLCIGFTTYGRAHGLVLEDCSTMLNDGFIWRLCPSN